MPALRATSRRRDRLRRLTKWSALATCVLTAALFVASFRCRIGIDWWRGGPNNQHYHCIQLIDGNLRYLSTGIVDAISVPGVHVFIREPWGHILAWWPRRFSASGETDAFLPLWLLFLVFALPTAIHFYRDRPSATRRRAGLCIACAYDRRGLPPAAPCPECGEPATSQKASTNEPGTK